MAPRSRAQSGSGSKKGKKEMSVAILGSGGVGKSCLTAQFIQGQFIDSYDPTIEDTYVKKVPINGEELTVEVQDTAGTEQFTAMRDRYIHSNDVYLLVFSLTSPSSLDDLEPLYKQILAVYESKVRPILDDVGLSATKATAPQFQPVDYQRSDRPRTRHAKRGPNPLLASDGPARPKTAAASPPSLPPLPLLILANKADIPATQHIFSKEDIAARINRWHHLFQKQSRLPCPIPAPKVMTTSAKSRYNVDESFLGVIDLGVRIDAWIQANSPAVPSLPLRNPFSRTNSSTTAAVPPSAHSDGRNGSNCRISGRNRSRANTRTSQATAGSDTIVNASIGSSSAGVSPPRTAVGACFAPDHSDPYPVPMPVPAQSRKKNIFSRSRSDNARSGSNSGHKARTPISVGGGSKSGSCTVM